jgi:hypothetical protein
MKVVHCKREPFDVYIGRPTKWGNPFAQKMGYTREQAIAAYARYLAENPSLVEDARRELKGKVLGCWCAPQPCHGDLLLRIANEVL